MKKIILGFTLIAVSFSIQSQEVLEADQNPNYRISQAKYTDSIQKVYTQLQGTTAQETYKAIDPLEEKRELKALRRQYRAQRPLWRHQRRLERIKNTQYFRNDGYYGYNNYGFRYNNFSNRYRGFGRNNGWNLLELGLLGALIFD